MASLTDIVALTSTIQMDKACRDCLCQVKDGVFFAPATMQWFLAADLMQSRRQINPNTLICYCESCYIRGQLDPMPRCLHCCARWTEKYYDSKNPSIRVWANQSSVQNWAAQKHYGFSSPRPDHLRSDGRICGPCTSLLISNGVLKEEVGQSLDSCVKCHSGKELTRVDGPNYIDGMLNGSFSVSPAVESPTWPCSLCSDCLASHAVEPLKEVTCDFCKREFQLSLGRDQPRSGWGCCAHLSETGVTCGYGSRYDDTDYAWKTVMPDEYRGKRTACDECFDALLKTGELTFLRSSST